jgi:hypothetical protein
VQSVAQVDVGDVTVGTGAEVKPAEELAVVGGLGGPGAETVEPLVDIKVERDDLVPENLPRCRPAEVTHHLGLTVEVKQVADVVLCELADGKSRRFQDDVDLTSIVLTWHLFAWDRVAILAAMNQAVSRLYAYEKPGDAAEEIGA